MPHGGSRMSGLRLYGFRFPDVYEHLAEIRNVTPEGFVVVPCFGGMRDDHSRHAIL